MPLAAAVAVDQNVEFDVLPKQVAYVSAFWFSHVSLQSRTSLIGAALKPAMDLIGCAAATAKYRAACSSTPASTFTISPYLQPLASCSMDSMFSSQQDLASAAALFKNPVPSHGARRNTVCVTSRIRPRLFVSVPITDLPSQSGLSAVSQAQVGKSRYLRRVHRCGISHARVNVLFDK